MQPRYAASSCSFRMAVVKRHIIIHNSHSAASQVSKLKLVPERRIALRRSYSEFVKARHARLPRLHYCPIRTPLDLPTLSRAVARGAGENEAARLRSAPRAACQANIRCASAQAPKRSLSRGTPLLSASADRSTTPSPPLLQLIGLISSFLSFGTLFRSNSS